MAADVDVVVEFVDALWNRGDEERVRASCRPEVAERMLAWAARVRAGGPDLTVELEHVLAGGDGAVATIQRRVQTHTGALTGPLVDQLLGGGGIAPTGKQVVSRSAVFYEVQHATITRIESFADNLAFFSQFGRLHLEPDA